MEQFTHYSTCLINPGMDGFYNHWSMVSMHLDSCSCCPSYSSTTNCKLLFFLLSSNFEKLSKSVAHLPWRAFGYKAFNTFIDDVFAFIIKMPTSHRIACLRDDVVFFCYLYQVVPLFDLVYLLMVLVKPTVEFC